MKTSIILIGIILSIVTSYGQPKDTLYKPKPNLPIKLNKISDNVYEVLEGKGSRNGVIIGDNGILVIDAKQDEPSVRQTIEEISKISDKPIKYLVNTHSDGDHVFGNQYFPGSVVLICQENCRKEFFLPKKDGSPSDWSKPELLPYVPSITFQQKMDIYLGSKKVELWYFGVGHTSGDAVIYFPEQKVAFLGDQIFTERPQLIHTAKGGNSFEHVKTLTKMLQELGAEKFCSGHSPVLNRAEVQKHIDEMKNMQKKIKTLMESNKTLDNIKGEFDKNQSTLVEIIYNEIKNNAY
jgi:glyoxylase-like metal-dependent hydrolase (beta-lactamase superfamily II)